MLSGVPKTTPNFDDSHGIYKTHYVVIVTTMI